MPYHFISINKDLVKYEEQTYRMAINRLYFQYPKVKLYLQEKSHDHQTSFVCCSCSQISVSWMVMNKVNLKIVCTYYIRIIILYMHILYTYITCEIHKKHLCLFIFKLVLTVREAATQRCSNFFLKSHFGMGVLL